MDGERLEQEGKAIDTTLHLFGDMPEVQLGIPRIEITLPAAALFQLRHVPSREPEKEDDDG